MAERPSEATRREFLSVEPLRRGSPTAEPPTGPRRPTYLLEVRRRAMACDFVIHLNAGQYPNGPERAMQAMDLLEPLEQQMSVYRADSELSRINQQAAIQAVPVEARLLALLQGALQRSRETDGAFDITSGPLVKVWGFFRRQGRMPTQAEIDQAMRCTGSHLVALDEAQQTIRFQCRGVEINLGAIGKGYALDRCGQWLVEHGVDDFLVHGGFSSVLARGSRQGPDPGEGWLVAIRHPLRPRQAIAEIRLANGALGTSGSGTQYFHHHGKRYGHILDPRTGRPVEGILSATAVAPDAASADALSTAFYVMGVEQTAAYCQRHAGVGALLVVPGPKAGTVTLHSFGMDHLRWRRCDEQAPTAGGDARGGAPGR